MAQHDNNSTPTIQLPPGYENATITRAPGMKSASPANAQAASATPAGVTLPVGYEGAIVTRAPGMVSTAPGTAAVSALLRLYRAWLLVQAGLS